MARKRRKCNFEEDEKQSLLKEEDSQEEDNPDNTIEGSAKKKLSVEDPFIVISDSDEEAVKAVNGLPKRKGRLARSRRVLEKRRIAQMSEEEQLALAVKISEQEANHVNYNAEEDDDILRKAIEESLHCREDSDLPKKDIDQQKDKETISTRNSEDLCKELSLSQTSEISGQAIPKSPVVLLTRLSQDIVESDSVILSPNNSDTFSRITSPSVNANSDNVLMSPLKSIALSPVFPRKSPCTLGLVPRKLFQDNGLNSSKLLEELDDQCSHCSESPQLDSSPVIYSSLQAKTEDNGRLDGQTELNGKPNILGSRDRASVITTQRSTLASSQGCQNESTVHYYWGVPFCPKGENPSTYTQVILCQLEVYQKSLKGAQRQLLNKVDFGGPIELSVASLSCSKSEKGDSQGTDSQEETSDVKEDVFQQRNKENESDGAEDFEKSGTQPLSSRKRPRLESPVPSPHEKNNLLLTQEETASTNSQAVLSEVALVEVGGEVEEPVGKSIDYPNDSSYGCTIVHSESAKEEEITVCPETQPSPIKEVVPSRRESVILAEIHSVPKSGFPIVPSAEEDAPAEPSFLTKVECPLCGQEFSSTQIEMHAAYCDGTCKDDTEKITVLRSRKRIVGKNLASPDDILPTPDSGKCEKCYLCKSRVPIGDYKRHVDSCIQNATQETQNNRKLRTTKESAVKDGRLLRMLEQSESESSEANTIAPIPDYISASPPKEDSGVNPEDLSLVDSPIRSFVSISEAKDCLVDFKQQFSRRPGSSGLSNRVRGRRRRR